MASLPETNSSPLRKMASNRNLLFQWSIFRGELLYSFREGILGLQHLTTNLKWPFFGTSLLSTYQSNFQQDPSTSDEKKTDD